MPTQAPDIRNELHYGDRVVKCFAERPATVDAMFRRSVDSCPHATAIVDVSRSLTYAELARMVENAAGNLAAMGLLKGDRIGLLVGNRAEFLIAVLAASRLGARVVPLSTRQKRPETQFVLEQCAAKALIYDAACAASVPSLTDLPTLAVRLCVGEGDDPKFSDVLRPSQAPDVTLTEEDDFCLLYTSGTTGKPKGARLTHLGVIHSVLNYRYGMRLEQGEVSILAVPASHVTGLIAVMLTMIAVGGTTIAMTEFKARRFLELAAERRMTQALLVPAMYNLCLMDPQFASFDLTSWRIGGFGGAPMPEATIERLARTLPQLTLLNVYGSTETTSPVTMMPHGAISAHRDTVGRPLPGAEIIVMDDDGRERAPGLSGELWIAGPMVIPGYWNNPDANRSSFRNGYWLSGDIGSVDADGFVRILDRKKDVINRGGYKIYCIEVENTLALHADVIECAVVPRPDPVLGQLVHAVIVRRQESLTAEALAAHCAASLSDYKVPTSFEFRDTLPRNTNGKIVKTHL